MSSTDYRKFRSRYVKNKSGCWLWLGHIQAGGYGTFFAGGRHWLAHRWSYTYLRGEIPAGLQLDHLCRVKRCVNPEHLEPVTNQENALRGVPHWERYNRSACPEGHEYTPENTYSPPSRPTVKMCRECRRQKNAEVTTRKRVARGVPAEGLPSNICRNGHIDERNSAGKCLACARDATRRYRERQAGLR